ncbi:hypothetical protein GGR58DRAFT_218613 [Xylaria digitata]|nr:hypothetical protein GGR58DRAFT_218613 [Xylaria digitata]
MILSHAPTPPFPHLHIVLELPGLNSSAKLRPAWLIAASTARTARTPRARTSPPVILLATLATFLRYLLKCEGFMRHYCSRHISPCHLATRSSCAAILPAFKSTDWEPALLYWLDSSLSTACPKLANHHHQAPRFAIPPRLARVSKASLALLSSP